MRRGQRRPDPAYEARPGTHWEAVPSPGWQVVTGKRCRWGRPSCKAPSVAELDRGCHRGGRRLPSWWAYCTDHLFGRWIEDGQVLGWRLVDDPPGHVPGAVP